MAFGVAMGLSRLSSYPLPYMLATKSALAVLGFLVSLALRALYQRTLQKELPVGVVVLLLVVASYVAAFPWTAMYNIADVNIYEWTTGRSLRGFSYTSSALYHAFVLLAWSVLYYGIRQYAELQEGRERLLQAQSLATQARLSALRYQLNPHFLYNTLNAISTLVIDQRTNDATRMIARLSDLLRVTLNDQASDEHTLGSEIAMLRQYLEIERVRFGDRLSVVFAIAAASETVLVPSLILQPIVENAIRHGIAAREESGAIHISAVCDHDVLRVTVEDNGPGMKPAARVAGSAETSGIGLANVRERLKAHYGSNQTLTIEPASMEGVRVTMELPASRRRETQHDHVRTS